MEGVLSRARAAWRATDGWVLAANAAALGVFLGNTRWRSVDVVYAATLVPLAVLAARARRDATLRWSLVFGAGTALLWAAVEGLLARIFGWWGTYDAPGPRLWDTPLYCLLVGLQACSYVTYTSLRAAEIGLPRPAVTALSGVTALAIAALGENLFVGAGMWSYVPCGWMWGRVPAWAVLGYGSAYVAIPWLHPRRPASAAVLFSALTLLTVLLSALTVGFRGCPAG